MHIFFEAFLKCIEEWWEAGPKSDSSELESDTQAQSDPFSDEYLRICGQKVAVVFLAASQAVASLHLNMISARWDTVLRMTSLSPEEQIALWTVSPQPNSLFGPYASIYDA